MGSRRDWPFAPRIWVQERVDRVLGALRLDGGSFAADLDRRHVHYREEDMIVLLFSFPRSLKAGLASRWCVYTQSKAR